MNFKENKMTEIKKTREQLLNELETAENEVRYIKSQRKQTMKSYKEDLKDVDDRIKKILDDLEAMKSGK